ncbi:hypothetical protein N7495_009377 [Penicillium taxi]|uniref:uncharacterized protein n=1 Tax=Penicillium taxi TaxID=168475 RepID=UPI0025453F20|nr:uncharacterized protein N7495_009377 [Penicillium taxi]KAJ5884867.1 hypothetical protein N7495_009377 [Penicillium taxi]
MTSYDAKAKMRTKFPPEFNKKVDMKKVSIEVIKKWIAGQIFEILRSEDDVVTELCFGLLEGSRFPDIKALQIQLTGFLDKDTPKFCQELWQLCLDAQETPTGVPKKLLEAKKLELLQEKLEASRVEAARIEASRIEGEKANRSDSYRRRSRSPRRDRRDRRDRSRDRYRSRRTERDSYVPSNSGRGDNSNRKEPFRSSRTRSPQRDQSP